MNGNILSIFIVKSRNKFRQVEMAEWSKAVD